MCSAGAGNARRRCPPRSAGDMTEPSEAISRSWSGPVPMHRVSALITNLLLTGLAGSIALTSGCASSTVAVTASNHLALPLAGPFVAAPGSDPAIVAELAARGLVTERSTLLLTATRSASSPNLGICSAVDATRPDGCAEWRKPPRTRWRPFGTPVDYRLVLDFTEIASGKPIYRVNAVLRTGGAPLPDQVQRLVTAALACAGCTGGLVISPAN